MKQVKVISIGSSPNYEQVNHIQELLNTGWEIQACTSTYILLILESTDRVQELEPTTFKERLQIEEQELNIKLTKTHTVSRQNVPNRGHEIRPYTA